MSEPPPGLGEPVSPLVRDIRLCAIGDELVSGVGDPRALGWVGRVMARIPLSGLRLMWFPLAVPGESTGGLATRWASEAGLRFTGGGEHRLLVGLGAGDLRAGLSTARSRLNLANILDSAEGRGVTTFVVGPPPLLPEGPDRPFADAVAALSQSFSDVCRRRRVPYVDTWTPLATHDDWFADLAASGVGRPGQVGYGLLAWLVLHGGWSTWLGLEEPEES